MDWIPLGQVLCPGISMSLVCNPARWLKQKPDDKRRNIPQPHEASLALPEEHKANQVKSVLLLVCKQTKEHSGKARAQNTSKAKVQGLFFMTGDFPLEESFMNNVKAANHSLKIQKQQLIQWKKCLSTSTCAQYQQDEGGSVQRATVPPLA